MGFETWQSIFDEKSFGIEVLEALQELKIDFIKLASPNDLLAQSVVLLVENGLTAIRITNEGGNNYLVHFFKKNASLPSDPLLSDFEQVSINSFPEGGYFNDGSGNVLIDYPPKRFPTYQVMKLLAC